MLPALWTLDEDVVQELERGWEDHIFKNQLLNKESHLTLLERMMEAQEWQATKVVQAVEITEEDHCVLDTFMSHAAQSWALASALAPAPPATWQWPVTPSPSPPLGLGGGRAVSTVASAPCPCS